MKGSIAAAAVLLGAANAGIHHMPMKKVSLAEQLAGANIDTHVKHLSQKYMGVRPDTHADEMFKDTSIGMEKGPHEVPVSNFMNAQCMYWPAPWGTSWRCSSSSSSRSSLAFDLCP